MIFVLGIITGLLIALIIIATLTYFRRIIEKRIEIVQKAVDNKSPRLKGSVFIPPSDADYAREQILERNKSEGKDTPLSDLQ